MNVIVIPQADLLEGAAARRLPVSRGFTQRGRVER
jgi:hypothetical protein